MEDFTPKPEREEDFEKPVAWLVGRDLIAGLKWFALFAGFKGKLDPRDWMSGNCFPPETPLGAPIPYDPDIPPETDAEKCLNFWRQRNNLSWQWKVNNDTYWAEVNKHKPDFWKNTDTEEFWFDYIADSGDGQMGTYGIAYLCLSDMWVKDPGESAADLSAAVGSKVSFSEKPQENQTKLLPRGQFLFVGGDTAYHIADRNSIRTRFQEPFRWAFGSLRRWLQNQNRLIRPIDDPEGRIPMRGIPTILEKKGPILQSDTEPARPIFGIPANHDYYDVIDGFNLQFRKPVSTEHRRGPFGAAHLSLLGFAREQDSSYVALQLPFEWWLWGLDTEISQLDERQEAFFRSLNRRVIPHKLILATPEPTTVFRQRKPDTDKTLMAFAQLGLDQPHVPPDEPGRCRLDLSGDVHHYARYYGPNVKEHLKPRADRSSEHYASVVSGGGGAFMHPSQTRKSGEDAVEEQVLYPLADRSRSVFAKPLFNLRNIFDGGYVWMFGMIIAGIFYFALNVPQSSKDFLDWILCSDHNVPCQTRSIAGYHIPFVKDSNVGVALIPVRFDRPIDLTGFGVATLELIAAMGVLGLAIYLMYRYTKQLEKIPVVFEEDLTEQWFLSTLDDRAIRPTIREQQEERAKMQREIESLPTSYGSVWPAWASVAISLLLFAMGVLTCMKSAENLHPFGSSLLVLVHVIIAVELIVLSIQNSAWIVKRSDFVRGSKYSYLPVWFLAGLPFGLVFLGVWMFGRYPAAYVLSDTIFALVFVGLFVALIYLGWAKGGELQNLPGKLFMLAVGIGHALLQLLVPLLLIRFGDWLTVLVALFLIFLFSGVGTLRTEKGWPGIGAWLMKLPEPWSGITLTLFWFLYGAGLLGLPFLIPRVFHTRRATLNIGNVHVSSFLPQSLVDWMYANWGLVHDHPAVSLMVVSLLAAVALGFVLSMSILSWYFAVSLVFQGHNNEVGGAGRIEKFRHILRICVTRDKIRIYGIGFGEPAVDGHKLAPKLIDVFELRVT